MEITEKIASLQSLNIGPLPKAMIALVLLGQKPSVELDVFKHNTPAETVHEVLRSIGLWVTKIRVYEERSNATAKFCIADNSFNAEILARLVTDRDRGFFGEELPRVWHTVYGTLMGYPLSAIQAFLSNRTLSEESEVYPESLRDHLLCVFKFSDDCWAEEAETIFEWQANLELHAPKILEELQGCYSN